MGSKSRIAKYIVPIIQKYIDDSNKNYYEPFCGGCNVIDKINAKKKYASDANEYLIELLKHVQSGGDLPTEVPRDLYSQVRSNLNDYDSWFVGAVGFLASYNGRFFDGGYAPPNYDGKRYRNYYQESKTNLLNQAKDLYNIIFSCITYQKAHPKNLIIYADPPYKGTKQYSNSKNFNHDEFWLLMEEWSKDNIVLVSELQAPSNWRCIWEGEIIRSHKSQDKLAIEKLFIT